MVIIDLDEKGLHKWSQRKNTISPLYTCLPTSLIQAYEIIMGTENCFSFLMNYLKGLPRIPDKFTWFMRNEPSALEIFKFNYPDLFKKWTEAKDKDIDLYSNTEINPNEVYKNVCICFNLFINYCKEPYSPYCYSSYNATIESIKKLLKNKKPVLVSGTFDNIPGHIITIKGYTDEGFLIYDTYGCKYFEKFKTINKAKELPFNEFNKVIKPLNCKTKNIITFL